MLGTLTHSIHTFNFNIVNKVKRHRENKLSNSKIINGKFKVITPMDKIRHENLLGDKKLNKITMELNLEVKNAKQIVKNICKMENGDSKVRK